MCERFLFQCIGNDSVNHALQNVNNKNPGINYRELNYRESGEAESSFETINSNISLFWCKLKKSDPKGVCRSRSNGINLN